MTQFLQLNNIKTLSEEKAFSIVFTNMSKLLMLRQLVKQQLDSAADKICEEFERTASDYEEELSQFRQNDGNLKLLNAVFNPKVQLNRLGGYIFTLHIDCMSFSHIIFAVFNLFSILKHLTMV